MGLLNIKALSDAPLATDPFEYILVEGFVGEKDQPAILGDFPDMPDAGSFPFSEILLNPPHVPQYLTNHTVVSPRDFQFNNHEFITGVDSQKVNKSAARWIFDTVETFRLI